jgi:hypothetical protein
MYAERGAEEEAFPLPDIIPASAGSCTVYLAGILNILLQIASK